MAQSIDPETAQWMKQQEVTMFYADEIGAMANRCERFAITLGRRYPEVGDELRRIADELHALTGRLENR